MDILAIIALLTAFGASVVGGICGIGGGVVIKPVLDLIGFASVSAIGFLSSCTVLSMSLYNVGKSYLEKSAAIDKKSGTPLAVGAAIGGIAGQQLFRFIKAAVASDSITGASQAILLMVLVLGTLIYTVKKKSITPLEINGSAICLVIGLALGTASSFLGIGGGPFNLVVLHFFLGYETKRAVENSLYIVLLSQLANIMTTIISGSIPAVTTSSLLLMAAGGIAGGVVGKKISKKLSGDAVDKLFIALMVLIIVICIYNAYKYLAL